jgi:hypothetical protein
VPHADLDEQSKEQQPEGAQEGQEGEDGEVDAAAAAAAAAEEASFFQRRAGESALQYACRVFTRVYTTDIERVISMTVRGGRSRLAAAVYCVLCTVYCVLCVVPAMVVWQSWLCVLADV